MEARPEKLREISGMIEELRSTNVIFAIDEDSGDQFLCFGKSTMKGRNSSPRRCRELRSLRIAVRPE
jgi:hypothetical protein